jgi:hypothetical protein
MEDSTRYDEVTSSRRRTAFIRADIALCLAEQEISMWKDPKPMDQSDLEDCLVTRTESEKDSRIAFLEQELANTKRKLEAAKISEAASRSELERVRRQRNEEGEACQAQLSMLEAQMKELERRCTGSYLLSSSQRAVSHLNTTAATTDYSKTTGGLNKRQPQLETETSVLDAKKQTLHSKNWEDMRKFYEDRINILLKSVKEWKAKCSVLSRQMQPLAKDLQRALSALRRNTKETNLLY